MILILHNNKNHKLERNSKSSVSHKKTSDAGHYIGQIVFPSNMSLPPEALTITLEEGGNIFANTRMEFPDAILDPPNILDGDIESSWLGHYDSCNKAFYLMCYRQGIIPTLFNISIPSYPNYTMVFSGHLNVSKGIITSTDTQIGFGPLNWNPTQPLNGTVPLEKLYLKRYKPEDVLENF